MSKIIRLESENIKRLHAVDITPQGNVVVIGGRNGQGKSSVLDSIQYALGGDPADRMPVRRGAEKARVVVDLGDIVVRRTFTAAGTTALLVTDADGMKQSSPQSILDKLVGRLTFDPLAFSREKPKQQAEILRDLVGIDFTKQDTEREKLFHERTAINREVKTLEGRITALPKHDKAPDKEQSTADILVEQKKAADTNASHQAKRQEARRLKILLDQQLSAIAWSEDEIKRLEAKLAETRKIAKETTLQAGRAEEQAANLQDIDLSSFQSRFAEAEASNRTFRENRQRSELVAELKAKSQQAEKLTNKIETLDASKREATVNAKYPVAGLMFDPAGGVILNGIPFEQASASEQLRVSVAVGLALNPKLRVLLIRDGSLLDDDSMQSILKLAQEADAQVWIERVGTDAQTSVIIEDGHAEAIQEKPPEPILLTASPTSHTSHPSHS